MQHAHYSKKAADSFGGVVEWLNADGDPVHCTIVGEDPEADGYLWDDKEYLGEVVRFSRIITPSTLSTIRLT